MKFISALTISVLFFSCNWASSKKENDIQDTQSWKISDKTVTIQTYTPTHLLDTSFRTSYFYIKGVLWDSVKSLVVRQYENNKLTNTKDFTILRDSSKKIASETTKHFDDNGNLVFEATLLDNNIVYKSTNLFNDKKQMIQSVKVFGKEDVDSALKMRFHYDTTINNYFYDKDGNQISSKISDTRRIIIGTIISHYSGHEKNYSIKIDAIGDTTSNSFFSNDGNFIKQVSENKDLNTIDTTWFDKGKVVKTVGYNYKKKTKHKTIIVYNDKGDEIESVSYQ